MSDKKTQLSEEKTAAASYILNFYKEVTLLTHNYANYENLLLEYMKKYNSEDYIVKLSPDEADLLKDGVQTIRYYCTKTCIGYASIMTGIKKENDKTVLEVKEKYKLLKKDFVIDINHLQDYVILLNSLLLTTVVKKLLVTSTEIVNRLYGGQDKEPETEEGA